MSLKNLKLQPKLFIFFAGLILFVTLLVSVTVYIFQKNIMQQQANEKAILLTENLAYVSLNAILLKDYTVLQMFVDSMKGPDDILKITVFDTVGTVLASDSAALRGNRWTDPITQKKINSPIMQLVKGVSPEGTTIWETAVPVESLNERLGTVCITFSVEDTFQGLLQTIFGIGLAALLISLVISYYLSRAMVAPVKKAVHLAQNYGKGNFDVSIPDFGEDELGQLVNTLNQLSNKLSTLINEKIAQEGLLMIGEFSAYIIHDLKNPINGIHLLADGLHRRLPDDSSLKKFSAEILLASQRVEDFIRKTLDMTKSTDLVMEQTNINDLVEAVVKEVSLNSTISNKTYDQNIPMIEIDPRLMNMAIKNIVLNACEATRNYGEIIIETLLDDDIHIVISDTGTGIPPEKLSAVFRPFFSLKEQGHGLGLAMTKRAVELHRGQISVDSQQGKGTCFRIKLPVFND
jgi:signal transduction histidine kinase